MGTQGASTVTAIDCKRDVVSAALWLARAFTEGRRLVVWAPGADDHAHHVAVEFVHPVLVGARTLPAVAITDLSQIRCGDALLSIGDASGATSDASPITANRTACVTNANIKKSTVSTTAKPNTNPTTAKPNTNPTTAKPNTNPTTAKPNTNPTTAKHDPVSTTPNTLTEVIPADLQIDADTGDVDVMATYHVLWELVQVALEHPGLVGAGSLSGDSTGFLYPFMDASTDDETSLREALTSSAQAKSVDSLNMITETLRDNRAAIVNAAESISATARREGRVYTMGNGGSASDAARLARLLGSVGVDTLSLGEDYAVVTAIANDVGVDQIFARQIDALASRGDVLVGCSTSGASPNLLAAFRTADAEGVTTVGFSGYGGESFAAESAVQHRLTVDSSSVHRIQEAQAALMAELCAAVTDRLGPDSALDPAATSPSRSEGPKQSKPEQAAP